MNDGQSLQVMVSILGLAQVLWLAVIGFLTHRISNIGDRLSRLEGKMSNCPLCQHSKGKKGEGHE